MVVQGTTISTGGTGAIACWVTVTNGRTTQARSRPSAVPAAMLMAASPALSSESHADSCLPDSPTARQQGELGHALAGRDRRVHDEAEDREDRRRDEADGEGADDAEGDGVGRERTGPLGLADRRVARERARPGRVVVTAASGRVDGSHHSSGAATASLPSNCRSARVGRSIDDDRLRGVRRREGMHDALKAHEPRDAADGHRQGIADVPSGRLEEGVADDDRGRDAADGRQGRGAKLTTRPRPTGSRPGMIWSPGAPVVSASASPSVRAAASPCGWPKNAVVARQPEGRREIDRLPGVAVAGPRLDPGHREGRVVRDRLGRKAGRDLDGDEVERIGECGRRLTFRVGAGRELDDGRLRRRRGSSSGRRTGGARRARRGRPPRP